MRMVPPATLKQLGSGVTQGNASRNFGRFGRVHTSHSGSHHRSIEACPCGTFQVCAVRPNRSWREQKLSRRLREGEQLGLGLTRSFLAQDTPLTRMLLSRSSNKLGYRSKAPHTGNAKLGNRSSAQASGKLPGT